MKKIDTGRVFKDTKYSTSQKRSSNNGDTYSTRLVAGGKTYFTDQQKVAGGTKVTRGTSTDDGDKSKVTFRPAAKKTTAKKVAKKAATKKK